MPKLVDWLVPKNGSANLIDRSAISSTQQEVGSVINYRIAQNFDGGKF